VVSGQWSVVKEDGIGGVSPLTRDPRSGGARDGPPETEVARSIARSGMRGRFFEGLARPTLCRRSRRRLSASRQSARAYVCELPLRRAAFGCGIGNRSAIFTDVGTDRHVRDPRDLTIVLISACGTCPSPQRRTEQISPRLYGTFWDYMRLLGRVSMTDLQSPK
jgi:hypothetical protein